MMRRVLSAICGIALLCAPGIIAAEDGGYRYRAVCISLVPYVSTNGSQAENTINYFSLNLLGGYSGGLRGFELGSLLNMERGSVSGLQITAGANFVGLDASAIQIAGVFNYSNSLNGGQLALVNISGDVVGAQVGLVNIANDVQGAQIGFFNISNEVIGPTIGVFNVSKRGQFHIDLWASESSLPGLGVKMGSQYFHSILSFAAQPVADSLQDMWWMAGAGLGGHLTFDLLFVDIDGIAYMANQFGGDGMEFMPNLFKLQTTVGWLFPPDFAIFAGPSLNVFISEEYDGAGLALWDFTITESHEGGKYVRVWPGFTIGFQLR